MAQFDDQLNSLLSNPDSMAQIMNLAQSLSGGGGASPTPPPPTPPPPPPTPSPPPPPPSMGEGLSALTGGLDPSMLMRMMPLIQSLGSQNSQSRQLLYAIKPYLPPERQEKVDRAIQLARMICVGKTVLSEWGREGV